MIMSLLTILAEKGGLPQLAEKSKVKSEGAKKN
jgi:hypothetical protein